jgi:UDP-GlcNAc:undecaprenyl-phosphate/decaprenyl-phosphate GlcNAc-1-phosphate transferase
MAAGFLTFTIALITSLAATVLVRKFAVRVGMVDRPGPRKIHLEPIPLLGGIAIYAALILAVLVSYPGQALNEILGILAASTLLLLVGTLDDRGLLHHQVKLLLAMPIAGLIVLSSGIRVDIFSTALPGRLGSLADAVLTVLWITGITAAFSILDYMDGVCAGIAAIASLFLIILASLSGQVLVSTLSAAVLGAALGFLKWNFSPAKIFMGDGGAMLLGFLVATLAVELRVSAVSRHAAWLAPMLVLTVPIFDTALVSVSRLRRGLVPFTSPGKDHTGHRLANSGLGTRASVLILYVMGTTCGFLAILSTRINTSWVNSLAVLVLLGLIAAIALLECFPYERGEAQMETSA